MKYILTFLLFTQLQFLHYMYAVLCALTKNPQFYQIQETQMQYMKLTQDKMCSTINCFTLGNSSLGAHNINVFRIK